MDLHEQINELTKKKNNPRCSILANYLTNSSYFRTIDRGYNCILVTTTTIVIIIITIMMIIIMMIMMMMMMMMMIIIKIVIGGHHRLIFMHLLKVYARSKTTGIY